MSLFVINRYEGEKEEPTSEANHLSLLLKRIEERKLQKSLKKPETESSEPNLKLDSKPHKRGKKNKRKLNELETPEESKKSSKPEEFFTDEKNEAQNGAEKNEKSEKGPTEKIIEGKIDSTDNSSNLEETRADFVVLGSRSRKKAKEVRRVLPDWLSRPEIISRDLDSGPRLDKIEKCVLDERIVGALKVNGLERLFPVQERVLGWLNMADEDRRRGFWIRDVCVSAPTGSGKTLAYVLPVIQILKSRLVPKVRCLIVVPVQELAAQVHKVTVAYAGPVDLRVALLSGSSAFDQEQANIVKKNSRGELVSLVDIVVATPGRLIDHLFKTPGFSLDDLRFLVIDEADKNADWLEYIPERHRRSPKLSLANMRDCKMPAQKLLFSATLTQDPEKLSRLGLLRPILFTSVVITDKDGDVDLDEETGDFVGRYTSPDELEEKAVECPSEFKPVALYHLLTDKKKSEGRSFEKNEFEKNKMADDEENKMADNEENKMMGDEKNKMAEDEEYKMAKIMKHKTAKIKKHKMADDEENKMADNEENKMTETKKYKMADNDENKMAKIKKQKTAKIKKHKMADDEEHKMADNDENKMADDDQNKMVDNDENKMADDEENLNEGVKRNKICKCLVFTNSGDTAHRLSILLKSMFEMDDVNVGELSARFAPKEREEVLRRFSDGRIQVLICSDALARGMDIPGVELVVSYDLPKHIKGYIHRSGRTGRAGKPGTAVSILTTKQTGLFRQMLTAARKRVPEIKKLENLDTVASELDFAKHIGNLKTVLESEKRDRSDRAKTAKRKN